MLCRLGNTTRRLTVNEPVSRIARCHARIRFQLLSANIATIDRRPVHSEIERSAQGDLQANHLNREPKIVASSRNAPASSKHRSSFFLGCPDYFLTKQTPSRAVMIDRKKAFSPYMFNPLFTLKWAPPRCPNMRQVVNTFRTLQESGFKYSVKTT